MSIIRTSIKQPVLVNLLFFLVVVAGFFSARGMTKEIFQDVNPPGVLVVTPYPGISAQDVEKLLTRPIENAIYDVSGVAHVFSSSREGFSRIWAELVPGADADKVVLDIQSRISEIRRELPPDAENSFVRPGVVGIPAIVVTLTGPPGRPHQLRAVAKKLIDRLEAQDDVDRVTRYGLRQREIRVVVKPENLEAYHVSLEQVAGALKSRNRNLPGGTISIRSREYVVRAMSEFGSLDEIRELIVARRPDGKHVRLRHLAEVRDGFAERTRGARVDARPGVIMWVMKKKGSDAHKVVTRIRRAAAKFNKSLPAGFQLKLLGDTTKSVDRGMAVLYKNGLIGIALVLALLWLFIGLRNAIMTAIGIPFALFGALLFMSLMGITINKLSLFALIICVGIIVDDAIVVVENTYRYLEEGKTPVVAALLGTKEVMWPVICTVLTTIAAFLPLLMMTGVMGEFFSIIPKVVAAALAASLLEALIILPSHVADFGKVRRARNKTKRPKTDGAILRRAKAFYQASFRWALKLRYLTLALALGLAGTLAWATYTYKDIVLYGEEDAEMIDIRVVMPLGTALGATEKVLEEIERRVKDLPASDMAALLSQSGHTRTDLWPQTGKHLGMVTLMLEPYHRKGGSRKQSADEIVRWVRKRLETIPGPVKAIEVVKLQFKPPTGKPLAIRIAGQNPERLLALAQQVEAEVAKIPGVKDIGRDLHVGTPEYRLHVDEAKAALHGLGTAEVARMILIAYQGFKATKFRQGNEEMDVVLRYPEHLRRDPRELGRMAIFLPPSPGSLSSLPAPLGAGAGAAALRGTASSGAPRAATLTLADVCEIKRGLGFSHIRRRDRRRTVTVAANIDPETGMTSQRANLLAKERLQRLIKANPDITFSFGGEFEKTQESLESLARAALVAILAIYLILGAQFRSFLQPVVVLIAVPLSAIGVAIGFFVSGSPVDIVALLGVVGLAGIVVNDSLILVDFINQRRRQGIARNEAIREAGMLRLRPIILTSITTIAGLMPMSMGWGGDAEGLAPMATSIAWGLSFATILILYVVPCAYAILDDMVGGIYRLRGKQIDWVRRDLDEVDALDQLPLKDAIRAAEDGGEGRTERKG